MARNPPPILLIVVITRDGGLYLKDGRLPRMQVPAGAQIPEVLERKFRVDPRKVDFPIHITIPDAIGWAERTWKIVHVEGHDLPPGYVFTAWDDWAGSSIDVRRDKWMAMIACDPILHPTISLWVKRDGQVLPRD